MLSVAVEGDFDQKIVEGVLRAARINGVVVKAWRRNLAPRIPQAITPAMRGKSGDHLIVVYDLDDGSVGDAVALNDSAESYDGVTYCPAIPTVDAWLFADSKALFETLGEKADQVLGRMPLPEQIPYPKALRHALLRSPKKFEGVFDHVDIQVAGSRSPSLKYFLQQAYRFTGTAPVDFDGPTIIENQIDRALMRNLISEVYPSSAPLFRSASGEVYTGEQMMQEVIDGTDIGREYMSDVLRVARDFLARQAKKKTDRN